MQSIVELSDFAVYRETAPARKTARAAQGSLGAENSDAITTRQPSSRMMTNINSFLRITCLKQTILPIGHAP
ncbi:MAG: hypothetical protein LJE59_00035 [Chromatiaceae bacterium]|nr:hypothetical protein [Chromatiaceae bacterium]